MPTVKGTLLLWDETREGKYIMVRVSDIKEENGMTSFEYVDKEHEKAAQWNNDVQLYYVPSHLPHPFAEPVFVDKSAHRCYVGLKTFKKVVPQKSPEPDVIVGACVICMARSFTHALIPCGHYCLCETCAMVPMDTCPLCRTDIQGTLRIY